MAADRTTDVLDATQRCLIRYGMRRTTMDDIAGEMAMSRSAIYQYVRNKEDAVRQLSARMHDQALHAARRAAAEHCPVADRVHGILTAKLDLVCGPFADSPHAAELLDEQARVSGDICRDFTADLIALLTEVFAEARVAQPDEAAQISLAILVGLIETDHTDLLRPALTATIPSLATAPPWDRDQVGLVAAPPDQPRH
ncbi:TetR/AcrR family transcriptional regulator [Nocardia sp. NBC_00565]|uniref:TetR/AcrR family transcriptional regulator n=1 Tax=Nocardia sp. NBC_00565 TaxID=2975993 RepID=UPI002E80B70A|nr:helix-turn-helix domain-containing protein [Nocardia sp. NBC_00565]WUC07067.1 TetR/AcrR family transcriptional regulator [Nocardia sp. NBC_00565]